jgi:hypothetical protein
MKRGRDLIEGTMLDRKEKFICRINSTCKKINATDLSVEIELLPS